MLKKPGNGSMSGEPVKVGAMVPVLQPLLSQTMELPRRLSQETAARVATPKKLGSGLRNGELGHPSPPPLSFLPMHQLFFVPLPQSWLTANNVQKVYLWTA